MVGKWFLWMKQYIPRDEQGMTVKNCCLQAALSGGCSTLAGDSVLAIVPLGHFIESDARGESMGANL